MASAMSLLATDCYFDVIVAASDYNANMDRPPSTVASVLHRPISASRHYRFLVIISYHIVDLKRQNRLRVGTDKPKLKVEIGLHEMQTAVSIR